MEATVEWKGVETILCTAANGKMMELDGGGGGISPVVATLQAAGACSLLDVVIGLKDRIVTNAFVELNAERSDDYPRVFTKINMAYKISGENIPEKLCVRLVEQSHSKYCTVSNMLNSTADITWSLELDC